MMTHSVSSMKAAPTRTRHYVRCYPVIQNCRSMPAHSIHNLASCCSCVQNLYMTCAMQNAK